MIGWSILRDGWWSSRETPERSLEDVIWMRYFPHEKMYKQKLYLVTMMKRNPQPRPKPFQINLYQTLPQPQTFRPSQYENAHFFPATYATLASLSPRACWQPVESSTTSPEIFQTMLREVESNLYAIQPRVVTLRTRMFVWFCLYICGEEIFLKTGWNVSFMDRYLDIIWQYLFCIDSDVHRCGAKDRQNYLSWNEFEYDMFVVSQLICIPESKIKQSGRVFWFVFCSTIFSHNFPGSLQVGDVAMCC